MIRNHQTDNDRKLRILQEILNCLSLQLLIHAVADSISK